MIGILTEKPSAARNFAKALGGMRGTYHSEAYVIARAAGHLYQFATPENNVLPELSEQYKNWRLENLPWKETDFLWKRNVSPNCITLLTRIKETLVNCDEIVIATDNDPSGEGELLAWEILDGLKLTPKKWSRMFFEDESEIEIQKAFINRKPIPSMLEDKDYLKALYRTKWDYLSMQFTRIATKVAGGKCLLRQGRLKSAMVQIVGDGQKAFESYQKIPFYQNKFRDENGIVYSSTEEPQFKTPQEVPQIYHATEVVVDSVQRKTSPPPALMDLAKLSSLLAGQGIKPAEILATYQKMYEEQIVSYPRTEDKFVTPEQYNELFPKIEQIAKVVGVNTKFLTYRTPRTTHVKDGGTHGANRPGSRVPDSLSSLMKYGTYAPIIYSILAKNYLAMFGEDYEYEQQKGHLKDYPLFKGQTNIPKKLGYKAIFSDDEEIKEDKCCPLGKEAVPFVSEDFPPKPPIPTMKWLMVKLEKYDVGTGATKTSTFADITDESSHYPLLYDRNGKLSLTQYGQISYTLLPNTHIGNLKMTEQLMKEMREIANGTGNAEEYLAKIKDMVVDDIQTMQKNKENLSQMKVTANNSFVSLGKCPNCGGNVFFGKFGAYCSERCGIYLNQAYGIKLSKQAVKSLLAGKKTLIKGFVSKSTQKKYNAFLTIEGVEDCTWNKTGAPRKQIKYKMEFPPRK